LLILPSATHISNLSMAKKILSVSDNDALRITRHMMLANQGFDVISVANLRELRTALKSGGFDLVILGISIDGPGKREMAKDVRRLCDKASILELCRISPEVPDAEHHLISAEPAEIDHAVGQILRGNKLDR
jgi:CheY-like chemotaxis protein